MTTAGTLTAPRTAHPVERFARTHHRTLERWLTRRFGRQLTPEDVSDVLSETYRAALETEETREFEAERMRAWAYQVARYRAIAMLRERHGRSVPAVEGDETQASSRRVILSLDQVTGVDKDTAGGTGRVGLTSDSAYAQVAASLSDELRAEEARRVTDALLRLPADQREALQHVHVDGLSVRAAAETLGISKSTFCRIHQRAIQRLQSLCAAEQGADCARARALLVSKAALAPELVGWRDAHIEGCFSCQVAAGRRAQIMLPALPVTMLIVPSGFGRLPDVFARLTARIGSLVSRTGGLPDEAVAAGGAAAGGTIAGTSVLGGIGVKAVACAVAACAAVAAVPVVAHRPATTQSKAAGARESAKPTATPTPVFANSPKSTAPVATPARRERATEHASQAAAAANARRKAALVAKRRKAARVQKNAVVREFSPESFASAPASSGPAAPSLLAASASTKTAPLTSAPSRKSASRPGSSFSEEFRP